MSSDLSLLNDVTLGQVFAVVGAITAIVLMVRKTMPFMKKISNFLDDWNGTEARAGVEAHPGVMARLGAVETGVTRLSARMEDIQASVGEVAHEVKPNSGKSMADRVNQIAAEVGVFGRREGDQLRYPGDDSRRSEEGVRQNR